jgi:hypothetical protein
MEHTLVHPPCRDICYSAEVNRSKWMYRKHNCFRQLHYSATPMKYFSTRGDSKELSFEEVRLYPTPLHCNPIVQIRPSSLVSHLTADFIYLRKFRLSRQIGENGKITLFKRSLLRCSRCISHRKRSAKMS